MPLYVFVIYVSRVTRVDGCRRASTDVDARLRRSTPMEHNAMLYSLRVHTKRRRMYTRSKSILKLAYLGRGSNDFNEIWHADALRPFWHFRPLKIWNFENPRWRPPPSWNIGKSRNLGHGWNDFVKIWHCDAVPPSWPFAPLKNYFENPRWNLGCELICIGALT